MNAAFWRGRRVLVTGHTGFKGSWLAAVLDRLGALTLGVALPPSTKPNHFELLKDQLKLESVFLDIGDREEMNKTFRRFEPEVVIHMAAQSLVRESYKTPVETFATNVMGTLHVMDACCGLESVRSIVIVTTDKCYENDGGGQAFREGDRLGGHDPYSSSKACAELMTQSMRDSFWSKEIEAGQCGLATARAGNVIGGGDWSDDRIIPDLIRACSGGTAARIRNPMAVRPWQHVMDPLTGYLELAEKLHSDPKDFSSAWNFGPAGGETRTVGDIVKRAESILGSRLKWQADSGPHPHEAPTLKLDCEKALSRLHWRPRWNVEQAVQETFSWYEQYFKSPERAPAFTFAQIEQYGEGRQP
jgi:CDP-glucose 4,6-dehydratase